MLNRCCNVGRGCFNAVSQAFNSIVGPQDDLKEHWFAAGVITIGATVTGALGSSPKGACWGLAAGVQLTGTIHIYNFIHRKMGETRSAFTRCQLGVVKVVVAGTALGGIMYSGHKILQPTPYTNADYKDLTKFFTSGMDALAKGADTEYNCMKETKLLPENQQHFAKKFCQQSDKIIKREECQYDEAMKLFWNKRANIQCSISGYPAALEAAITYYVAEMRQKLEYNIENNN